MLKNNVIDYFILILIDQPQYFIFNADKSGTGRGPRATACAFWNDFLPRLRESPGRYQPASQPTAQTDHYQPYLLANFPHFTMLQPSVFIYNIHTSLTFLLLYIIAKSPNPSQPSPSPSQCYVQRIPMYEKEKPI